MNSERIIRIMAGSFILLSLLLGLRPARSITAVTGSGSPPSLGSTCSRAVLPASVRPEQILWKLGVKKPTSCRLFELAKPREIIDERFRRILHTELAVVLGAVRHCGGC